MIQPQVREAQPLIIQADVMREEMTSCCEVEYTGKSIPLLLHQVIYNKLCRSLGCYIGDLYNTPGKKGSTDECRRFPVTPFLATIRHKNLQQKSNTAHQRHLWNYCMYNTTIQHMYCTQTTNHFVAAITNVKDKDKWVDRQGAVYKIKTTSLSLDVLFTFQVSSKGSSYVWFLHLPCRPLLSLRYINNLITVNSL